MKIFFCFTNKFLALEVAILRAFNLGHFGYSSLNYIDDWKG